MRIQDRKARWLLPARASLALVRVLLVLSVALSASMAHAHGRPAGDGEWTALGGPRFNGGIVGNVVVDHTTAGTLYMAVQPPDSAYDVPSILYKSTDGAAHFEAIHTIPNAVLGMAAQGNLVLAGVRTIPGQFAPLLYRSSDGGQTWDPHLNLGHGAVSAASIHPTNALIAIAGGALFSDEAMLYRTDNGGTTWNKVFSYAAAGKKPIVTAALIHPTSPTICLLAHEGIVGGVRGGYIWRSDNTCVTWTQVYSLAGDTILGLAAKPGTNIMWAGTMNNNLYQSADAGLTWQPLITDGSAGQRLAFQAPNTLYAVSTGLYDVRKSTDGGVSWGTVGMVDSTLRRLAIDSNVTPNALYAATDLWGLFESTDDGAHWDVRLEGVHTDIQPKDIDVDPRDPDKLFVAGGCPGGFATPDRGATWNLVDGWCTGAFAIHPEDSNIVWEGEMNCNQGVVRRSGDGGETFVSVYTAPFISPDCSGGQENIYALAIAHSNPDVVYAAGSDQPNWASTQAVILRTDDDGVSWDAFELLPDWSEVYAVAVAPDDPEIAYAGGTDCSGVSCVGFLMRTTDGGQTWGSRVETMYGTASIAVDPHRPGVVYAADGGYHVYRSTDFGDTWAVVREPPDPSGGLVAVDPNVPGHVYLSGRNFIAESADGGETWSAWNGPLGNGLPQFEAQSIAVDFGTDIQNLYTGFTGVWSYTRPAPMFRLYLPLVLRGY